LTVDEKECRHARHRKPMTVVFFRKNFRNPEDLERKFKSWDADGDGKITLEELRVSQIRELPCSVMLAKTVHVDL
jgi:hypothetical protein